ncbi:MAG: acyl-CoA thioesterase [Candidatus Krumholzibacteria bacterium]|nr:acyl-CoA thioesterase [Candidatus Krumholzibacteria bacterium]
MRVHTTELRVRYAETDKMGVAHHSSYLLWFELARTGLLREAGFPYRDLEAGGCMLPVIEYGCRLLRGAAYDDLVRIDTVVSELRSRTVAFRYRARRDGVLLVEGFTRHACIDPGNTLCSVPADVRAAIAAYRERTGDQ